MCLQHNFSRCMTELAVLLLLTDAHPVSAARIGGVPNLSISTSFMVQGGESDVAHQTSCLKAEVDVPTSQSQLQ